MDKPFKRVDQDMEIMPYPMYGSISKPRDARLITGRSAFSNGAFGPLGKVDPAPFFGSIIENWEANPRPTGRIGCGNVISTLPFSWTVVMLDAITKKIQKDGI